MRVTDAQLAALRTVLAYGGVWACELHSGRNRPGKVRVLTMYALERAGLVVCEQVEAPWRAQYAGTEWSTTSGRYFATAAGCQVVRDADDAALAAEVL